MYIWVEKLPLSFVEFFVFSPHLSQFLPFCMFIKVLNTCQTVMNFDAWRVQETDRHQVGGVSSKI